ncbi:MULTISPECIES: ATP-binding protein [unclassified Schlesneria]|uniref:HAMP domain-containing sensor histidine kinase n=1 Tax=Schlesneria TaxID=656899 RepID=UPI0035A0A161
MLQSPLLRRIILCMMGFGLLGLILLWLVSLSVPSTVEGLSTLRWRYFFASALLMVVGVTISAKLISRSIESLVELTSAAETMANGRLPERVILEADDELSGLANAFNNMVQSVDTRLTESQRTQQRITRENERLATILEAMVEGVIAIDTDQRILLANTAAITLLNLKPFDVVGRRTWESIRLPQIHDLIRLTLSENRHQQRMEFEVPWTQSIVAVVASRLPGTPCPGAVLVLHDVTDLRRLENLRREFVSNVSHELKTPLSTISACAETLLDGALEDVNFGRTFVTRIFEQSGRLSDLIQDLLELARLESGEHVFNVDSVEANAILKASTDAHLTIAQAKQLTLTTSCTENEVWAQADAEGLRTIVDNLISNAINYSLPGGVVSVESRRDAEWIYLEFKDKGVGIAQEYQTRIFERFYRVDRARSREVGGTGLGLSIVKHLCQLFGGSIKVDSQVGQGSTFTVQLRAAEAPHAAPETPSMSHRELASK